MKRSVVKWSLQMGGLLGAIALSLAIGGYSTPARSYSARSQALTRSYPARSQASARSQIAQSVVGSEKPRQAMQQFQQTNKRWIEIRLATQRLIAWEGNTPIYAVIVSTGKAATPTPRGVFAIQTRYRHAQMQGEGYNVPDVPYTMYYSGGYAIHGAYWHNRFGTPISHGCTNVAVNHAQWLFQWASVGTPVIVH